METRKVVMNMLVEYTCDKCQQGKMKSLLYVNAAKHYAKVKHKCGHCGHEMYLAKAYPYVEEFDNG